MAATGLRREAASSLGGPVRNNPQRGQYTVDWTASATYLRGRQLVILFASHSPPARSQSTGQARTGRPKCNPGLCFFSGWMVSAWGPGRASQTRLILGAGANCFS